MKRWQFSIRGLLVLTTVVAAALTIAIRLPGLFWFLVFVTATVSLLVAIFQSANFMTSDRRPRLSTLSWTLLGTFFALYVAGMLGLFDDPLHSTSPEQQGMGMIMAACSIVCFYRAARSWLHSSRRQGPENVAVSDAPNQPSNEISSR